MRIDIHCHVIGKKAEKGVNSLRAVAQMSLQMELLI